MAPELSGPHEHAGCGDFRSSRRAVLSGALALGGAGVVSSVIGDAFLQASYGATVGNNVLVVLSMRGGVDGLSLVVPHGDPTYAAVRPSVAIPTGSLLHRDAMFGLHPAFAPLSDMWTAGRMATVHAVGLPTPNRSHFAAMEEVEDANIGSTARQGWINRLIGGIGAADPLEAVQLGNPLVPTSLWGSSPSIATARLANLMLPAANTAAAQDDARAVLERAWTGQTGPLAAGVSAALTTADRTRPLALAPVAPGNGATYPLGSLGVAMGEAARLVKADIGTQVVALDYGSWDSHSGMGGITGGNFAKLLSEFAGSIAAFFVDLGATASRVTLVTLTEFGRRVHENGSGGTDHGWGSSVFLLGAGVNGGYHGRWPGLGSGKLVDGDLAVTTDYRDILAEVIQRGFPGSSVSAVLPGFTPTPVGVIS